MYTAIATDQSLVHPSSEKILSAGGIKYKNTLATFNPKWDVSVKSLHLRALETPQK